MLNPDSTLIIQIINFLFLLIILNIILYRPIRKILNKRREKIESFENMIENFSEKSAKNSEKLKTNIIGAKRTGLKEKEIHKQEGIDSEKGMVQDALSSANEKIGKAKEDIEKKILQARESLESEISIFSKELAEKIMGRSI